MVDPVLRIRLTVQRRLLNIDSTISWIEPDSLDTGGLASNRTGDIDFLKKGRGDEIDVLTYVFHTLLVMLIFTLRTSEGTLTWVWEKPHHGERHKTSHRTRIIIPR